MQSGWCLSCGGRRGVDGRCRSCDPWWTSPLLVTGVPVVAVFGLVIALVVARFAPKPSISAGPAPAPWRPVAGAPMAGPSSTEETTRSGPEPPTVAAPPPVAVLPNDVETDDPQASARALLELEALRQTVHEVEAVTRRKGTEVAAPLGEGPREAESGS